jgi:tol-pal system protein YbgF
VGLEDPLGCHDERENAALGVERAERAEPVVAFEQGLQARYISRRGLDGERDHRSQVYALFLTYNPRNSYNARMRRICAIAAALGFVSGSACTAALERDLAALRKQVRELSRQASTSQVRQEEMTNRLALIEDDVIRRRVAGSKPNVAPEPAVAGPPSAAPPRAETPPAPAARSESKGAVSAQKQGDGETAPSSSDAPRDLPVVRLHPKASGAQVAQVAAADPRPAAEVAVARAVPTTAAPAAERKRADASPADTASLEGLEPKPLYSKALAAFRAEELDLAMRAFAVFVRRFPEHSLADNALYWTGRARAKRGDHAAAIESYETLLRRYPTGNKVPDALLALADSHAASGRTEEARTKLARVAKSFPGSTAGRSAAQRLREMKR